MIKIYIKPIPGSLASEIFIVSEPKDARSGDLMAFFNFKETGEQIITTQKINYGEAANTPPTMILEERDLRELLSAFAKLGQERGIQSLDESTAKGKLEATERHLEDMRTLVFQPVIINKSS